MRVTVHLATNSVSTEIQVDSITIRVRDVTDGSRNVTDCIADRRRGDSGNKRLLGCLDNAKILGVCGAGDETDRRVTHPAVDTRGKVDADDVAIGNGVVVGEAVKHRVVDARADDFAER
ncbi:unannotated protein [freshwater metagenome]|uniref:Unannotated protein n=1 Tax=freshwater metagenome TaxID=449393 RepID=A0A6J6ERX0_9ZZZZ